MGGVCGRDVAPLQEDQEPRASNVSSDNSPYKATSAVDARILEILQKKKLECDADDKKSKNTFQKFVLKFGMIDDAFRGIKKVYNKYKCGQEGITEMSHLRDALHDLGADIPDEDVKQIFDESNLKRDDRLDIDEFIVSLAIGYLLGIIPEFKEETLKTDEQENEAETKDTGALERAGSLDSLHGDSLQLAKAFNLIVEAYLLFDEDASGTISWEEMSATLKMQENNAMKPKRRSSATSMFDAERWRELDWDGDGTITFQEFLLAFQQWINVQEDEEDE